MTTISVTTYGAVPNGETVQTTALQAALDDAHAQGGALVVVPAGTYITGSLRLYSHTELHLESGAVLQGSQALQAYQDFGESTGIAYLNEPAYIQAWHLPPYYFHALLCAYDAKAVAVTGEPGSVIDGGNLQDPAGEEGFRGPMGLVFARVSQLRLSGYTVINSSNWAHTLADCTDASVQNVAVYGGHDGFDLHHSRHVTISGCRLACGDDCFAGYDTKDVLIIDCMLNTACNLTRLSGQNVRIERCQQLGPGLYPHLADHLYATHALTKPYALAVDPNRLATNDQTFAHLLLHELSKLVMYRRGEKALLQDGAGLDALMLDDVAVDGLHDSGVLLGKGRRVALTLRNCRIAPPQGKPLLVIDDAVALTIENTIFTQPTLIATTGGQQWRFNGLTNFQRN